MKRRRMQVCATHGYGRAMIPIEAALGVGPVAAAAFD
jgi:hypothetical protein